MSIGLHDVCVLCACVPVEAGRGCLIPWNWNYMWLWAATQMLGTKPGSCAGAASVLSQWTISMAPQMLFKLNLIDGFFFSLKKNPCKILKEICVPSNPNFPTLPLPLFIAWKNGIWYQLLRFTSLLKISLWWTSLRLSRHPITCSIMTASEDSSTSVTWKPRLRSRSPRLGLAHMIKQETRHVGSPSYPAAGLDHHGSNHGEN